MEINGKKTYFIGGLIILLAIFNTFEIINPDTFITIITILLGGSAISLRNAIAKCEN